MYEQKRSHTRIIVHHFLSFTMQEIGYPIKHYYGKEHTFLKLNDIAISTDLHIPHLKQGQMALFP